MTKIIFINGAPRAGKDTVASICVNYFDHCYRLGFADHLKRATHAAYGLFDVPPFYFENCKDEPSDLFFGLSPRQAYIAHSEKYMKVMHGDNVFGDIWLRSATALTDAKLIVIPDSGFISETVPVIKNYGIDNCLLLRVKRKGCDFVNDSRSHITLPGITMKVISNNATTGALREAVISEVEWWLSTESLSDTRYQDAI